MNRHITALIAIVSLTAACGSTVQYSNTTTAVGQNPSGVTSTGTSGGLVTTATSGELTGGTSGSTSGQVLSGSTAATSSTGSTAGGTTTGVVGPTVPAGAGPESGRGFTRTTLKIGVGTSSDYNSFASSTGLKGLSYDGDPSVWFAALVSDINRHGGILGRKVELVTYDYNTAQELNNPAAANQQACTAWTQDTPVFAVLLAGFGAEDTLLKCLAKAKTPLVQVGGGLDYPLHYQETYKANPLYFNLDQMVGDRYDRLSIGRLFARHFFEPWNTRTGQAATTGVKTKVGLISFDDHDGANQLASQQRELRRHGLAADTIACPRSLTSKVSCEQSAVLRFASNGITHVFGADSTFMQNANSQNYFPRYFVAVEPAIFAANVPAKQLVGAMSEGYIPLMDAAPDKYPGDPTPATAACRKLMKAAGQATTDPSTLWLQMSACDEFSIVRDALNGFGSLGAEALRASLERLGSRASSALTWKTFLGPNDHASTVALRDLVFRPDIANFVYTSTTNYS
jgi:ABC-type branched-subunit amino acid transport system substrate-binding protein